MIPIEERLHGAIEKRKQPARIHCGARAAQLRIARNHNFGFRRPLLRRLQLYSTTGPQSRRSKKRLFKKIPPACAVH